MSPFRQSLLYTQAVLTRRELDELSQRLFVRKKHQLENQHHCLPMLPLLLRPSYSSGEILVAKEKIIAETMMNKGLEF